MTEAFAALSSCPNSETSGSKQDLLMCWNHRQIAKTGCAARVVNPLNSLYVVIRCGKKDIGHESLRISIIEGKPARLDLHHDPVTGEKNVIHGGQGELVGQRGSGRDGFRRL